MDEQEHFKALHQYFKNSETGYDTILRGSKHFGFHPKDRKVPEKEAQIIMQELVAEKLHLTSKDLVLDAGCGQGVVSTFLAQKYACHIEGISILDFEIHKANTLAHKLQANNNVCYSLMDYSKTNFGDNYFDCIYTTETLSHSPDIRKTLKEFYRILKKGGRIALFEYTLAEDKKFTKTEKRIVERVAKGSAMAGLKDFRHDQFHHMLSEAGFTNIKTEDITQNTAPSLARLKNIAVIPYHVWVKPLGLQEKFPNASAAVEFYKMAKKGLIRYNIFTANK